MEKVWIFVGLLWAVLLSFIALMLLDTAIRAKIDEIKARHNRKKLMKKISKTLEKTINEQVEKLFSDNSDELDATADEVVESMFKKLDEEDDKDA